MTTLPSTRVAWPGALIVMTAVAVVAVYSPLMALLAALAVVLTVVLLNDLTLGLAMFTLVTFFNSLPSGAATDIAKPVGFLLTISWAGALLRSGGRMPLLTRDRPLLAYLLLAFFAWAAISIVWAEDVPSAQSSAVRLALALVFMFVVHSTVRTPRDLRIIAWAFIIGTALSTLYGFVFGLASFDRFIGGLGDPNFMASVLVAGSAMSAFMMAATRSLPARLLLLGFILMNSVALIETQSRGGMVAFILTLLIGCVLAGRLRPQAIAVTLVAVALGYTYYAVLAPASIRERTADISAAGSTGRTDIWAVAWTITKAHPVVGVGLDNFQAAQSRYIAVAPSLIKVQRLRSIRLVTHNTYLQILTELGVIGLALLLAVLTAALAVSLAGLRKLVESGDGDTEMIARGVIVGVAGLLVAYVFLSGQYEKQLWLLIGLLTAIPTVAASALRTRDEKSPIATTTAIPRTHDS